MARHFSLLDRGQLLPLPEGLMFLRAGLAVLTIGVALLAGLFGLVWPSWYSPVFVAAGVVAATIAVAWLRKPVWALYAALIAVLLPEGLLPQLLQSYLNRSLTLVALGAWLFAVVVQRRRITWTGSAILMLGFVTWAAVTLFWARDLAMAKDALAKYALRLILYLVLVANEINTKQALNRLMGVLAFSGWVLALAGAAAVASAPHEAGARLQVLSANENEFGIWVLVTMSGVLWQATRTPGRPGPLRSLLCSLFIVMTVALVALSGSRSNLIALLGTLAAFWLWKPTRVWGRAGLVILALAAVVAPFVFSTTLTRFAIEPGDTALGGRDLLWQGAWQLIHDQPWLGVGIGNAPSAMVPYALTARNALQNGRAPIHNPILTIWAETGLLGLGLYLGVLAGAVYRSVGRWRECARRGAYDQHAFYALVSCVFLGYMIYWIEGGGAESQHVYFLMLALLQVPSHLESEGPAETVEEGACAQPAQAYPSMPRRPT